MGMDGVEKQYRPGCTLKGWKICGMYDYTECSIFLPAAGYYYSYEDNRYAYIGDYVYYWTSSAHTDAFAWMFQAGWSSLINMCDARIDTNSRYYNFSIRPVVAE